MQNTKPPFEDKIKEIVEQINRRKAQWTLSSMSFDDVRQEVLIRAWKKYGKFDPARGSFLHWINRLITNAINNILRDNYMAYQRPCITEKCVYNTGDDNCSKTKSGKQCGECLIYKIWEQKKGQHYNVKQTLPLENHQREAEKKHCNTVYDIDRCKKIIDAKMRKKLTRNEWAIYKEIYINGVEKELVGEKLGYQPSGSTYAGYQIILKLEKKVYDLAEEIVRDENLA